MQQKLERKEFIELMSKLRSRYQNAVSDPAMWLLSLETYWEECRRLEPDRVRNALKTAWREYPDWMPSLGQLVKLIEGDAKIQTAQAWNEVKQLARRSSSAHSDPIAAEAMKRCGGGAWFGSLTDKDLEISGRARFAEMYAVVAKETKALACA